MTRIIIIGGGLGVALYSLHHVAMWAERRGWIYYRNSPGSLGPYGQAFIEATSMFAPEVEHVIDERSAEKMRADVAESGDSAGDPNMFPGSVEIH